MEFQFYISTIIIESSITSSILNVIFQFYISTIIIGHHPSCRREHPDISILHKYDYNQAQII